MLLMQEMLSALFFARASAGNSIAARIAIMAIPTSNSIKVKPCRGTERRERSTIRRQEDVSIGTIKLYRHRLSNQILIFRVSYNFVQGYLIFTSTKPAAGEPCCIRNALA